MGAEVDPIRDMHDARHIYRTLCKWGKGNIKVAELFLIGCNCALRFSDLRRLKFGDIREGTMSGQRIGLYSPTKNLIAQKTGKAKDLILNAVAMDAVDKLMNCYPDSEYLFQSESNNVSKKIKPFSRQHVSKIFKDIQDGLALNFKFNTHSMRKTFGYHAYDFGQGVPVEVLQELFQHGSPKVTLRYIGITQDTVREAYINNPIVLAIN